MEELSGKVAFITGGAQGIGLGVARAFAREGVSLALADVDAQALRRAEEELKAQSPVITFVLDVRDRKGFAEAADAAEARLGPVNILVNNAGIAGVVPVERLTYEAWDWVLGVNLNGVVNGVQTFLPRMLADGREAYIVNTASGAGLVGGGRPGVLYTTSKFGVVGMSEALRADLKRHGIGVSVLCPGPVDTGIIDRTNRFQPEAVRASAGSPDPRSESKSFLAGGRSPDAVGPMVVEAIKANRLFIHTDRFIEEPFKRRAQAVLEALPQE